MSVVRRCPNCGTTRANAGECEACHEAQVRYFCTNHTPGLWLEANTCPACGDVFGRPARPSSPPSPSGRAGAPVAARATPSSHPPAPRKAFGSASGRRERLTRTPVEELHGEPTGVPAWQRLLLSALRARALSTRPIPGRARPAVGRRGGGCLKSLLLMGMLLFALLAGAAFLFGRAMLQVLPY